MARRPAWHYRRQAQRAEARETFLANYEGPPVDAAVQQRGPASPVFYRSMALVGGAEHQAYTTNVDDDTLTQVTAAEAGLLETLPTGESANRLRGSGIKPTRAHWYRGDATPTRETSRWGTRWTRYYTAGSHRSIPFSRPSGLFTPDDLRDQFTLLFGPTGTKRALLGASNGRAYLELEIANLGFNS